MIWFTLAGMRKFSVNQAEIFHVLNEVMGLKFGCWKENTNLQLLGEFIFV